MEMDSKQWMKYSISIWKNLRTQEEQNNLRKLEKEIGIEHHPATFPIELCRRLILIYTNKGEWVLDPFMGTGTVLVASKLLGRNSIGIEINESYVRLARRRLKETIVNFADSSQVKIFHGDARDRSVFENIPNHVDLIITSPPYWDIHTQKRTADRKKIRPYSEDPNDLGNIHSYPKFLEELGKVFNNIYQVLKNGKYLALVVMDIRKGKEFYPFHLDCITLCKNTGFQLEDIIIWDRNDEYSNMKPLGYPFVFRVNKVHEYILLFKK